MVKLLSTSLLLVLAAAVHGQSSGNFVPLFGNDSLEGWSFINTERDFFSLENGVLTVREDRGWLRSPREYGDFTLRGELRFVTPDADSGIFLRAGIGTEFIRGWPGDSYQVQVRDISVNTSDSPLPLVNLYRHRVPDGETRYRRDRVFELYTGVGQWQQVEIDAIGERITVRLNGEEVTVGENIVNPRGYIGFQSETGEVEYRNLMINEH